MNNTRARQKTAHGQNVFLHPALLGEWAGTALLKSSLAVLGLKEVTTQPASFPLILNPERQPGDKGEIRRPCQHHLRSGDLTAIWASVVGGTPQRMTRPSEHLSAARKKSAGVCHSIRKLKIQTLKAMTVRCRCVLTSAAIVYHP